MPVLLEVLAAVMVASLLLWLMHRLYRKVRPLPLLNLTITKVTSSYHRCYTVRCGVCNTTSDCDVSRDTVFPVVKCSICGEGGSLRRVQHDMRRRLVLAKQREEQELAAKKKAERDAETERREGGRRLDL